MGSLCSKKQDIVYQIGSGHKTINLVSNICSSWGFEQKAEKVKLFCNYLANEEFTVNAKIIPISGYTGVYDIIQITPDNKKVIVFSNNSKNTGAVIDKTIKESDYSNIKNNLIMN